MLISCRCYSLLAILVSFFFTSSDAFFLYLKGCVIFNIAVSFAKFFLFNYLLVFVTLFQSTFPSLSFRAQLFPKSTQIHTIGLIKQI